MAHLPVCNPEMSWCFFFLFVYLCLTFVQFAFVGSASERGRVMGIFRSLGALSRAIGPALCCSSKSSCIACLAFPRVGSSRTALCVTCSVLRVNFRILISYGGHCLLWFQ